MEPILINAKFGEVYKTKCGVLASYGFVNEQSDGPIGSHILILEHEPGDDNFRVITCDDYGVCLLGGNYDYNIVSRYDEQDEYTENDGDFIGSIIDANAERIAGMTDVLEVKAWLGSLLYCAISYARSTQKK